jgi:integrase
MPKTPPQAILERAEVSRAIQIARRLGPFEGALFAWVYEFGARASEPGLQQLKDVDVKHMRARPFHLKDGLTPKWHKLLKRCRETLPAYLDVRAERIVAPEQRAYLFPSKEPGQCATCGGTGNRPILRRDGVKRFVEGTKPCRCDRGRRWGVSRVEVRELCAGILRQAGVADDHCYAHVLRHSIITHLLEKGVAAMVVKSRVGHKALATTLGYAEATDAAAAVLDDALEDV